jgi:hypothetical protein
MYGLLVNLLFILQEGGGDRMSADYVRNEMSRFDPLTSLHLQSACPHVTVGELPNGLMIFDTREYY